MSKEHQMVVAHTFKKLGYKQFQIAERLGVTDRTVRNYLKHPPAPRLQVSKHSKLDPFKPLIDSIISLDPFHNCILLFKRLVNMGYNGKISIMRKYAAMVRKKVIIEAVIRFETEPGRQAQVDWKLYHRQLSDGTRQKVYAFVMLLGFSRNPFVKFTRSMKQSVLLSCHIEAFEYFGGVPHEILYDNMKTAFICDAEGQWHPNKRLLQFAHHYGFVPKRCQIYRPQTKGKVERAIGYLNTNFWPQVKDRVWELDELNEEVSRWCEQVCQEKLRDFQETRAQRFEHEKPYLLPIPDVKYDYRDVYELIVNRETLITFETNQYSVPPDYIGETVTLKVDPVLAKAEVFKKAVSIREFQLEKTGSRAKIYTPEDKAALFKIWEKQQERRLYRIKKTKQAAEVEVRSPGMYDQFTGTDGVA